MLLMTERPTIYTAEEAAVILKLHVDTVKRLCRTGQLRAKKVGHMWRISQRAIDEYMGDIPKGKEGDE